MTHDWQPPLERQTAMEVLARKSQHEGHDPHDERTKLVEDLAMVMCGYCSAGDHRWRDAGDGSFYHRDEFVDEGKDCEASRMLEAALDLKVPIYTGAELEFSTDEE